MEHTKNIFTPVAEWDSATGNVSNIVTGEPFESVESIQPVPFDRQREDGWTPERQRQFLEELADCGIVREAAARVGMSRQSAWQLRRRAAGTAFASVWEAALQAGMQRLHSVAFERAIEGVVKHVYYRGEVVGEQRIYDNRLLLALLEKVGLPFNDDIGSKARAHWPEYLDAVEQGLSRPGRVWPDEGGGWWTDYPPPDHAVVVEEGGPGHAYYRRRLTDEELEVVEAREARHTAEEDAERGRFFSSGK